jgi:phospholipase C
MQKQILVVCALCLATGGFGAARVQARGPLSRVKHIIIVMQENHSFDNYFGVLPYAGDTPYEPGPCAPDNHACVDGLTCARHPTTGVYHCRNFNREEDGTKVFAFHSTDYCVQTDLDHSWVGTHRERNVAQPNARRRVSPNDGFVIVNDVSTQPDTGGESRRDDATMSFYNEADLGFYYDLAATFALSDRHFSAVLGPTFPNRAYLLAATSFGHIAGEPVPDITQAPFLVYRPITGTLFDLLDQYGVSWAEYFTDAPPGASFRNFVVDPQHFRLVSKPAPQAYPPPIQAGFNAVPSFFEDAQAGTLPSVAFVDAASGVFPPIPETDEHPGPGSDIRAGQRFVAHIVDAVRRSPNWEDSIVFITYDEHGGFYDHVAPPAAPQGGARTPDGIAPGQCADASHRPESAAPSGGLNCTESQQQAAALCPEFSATGPFPPHCATFNQLGMRVPLLAVSPFAKPHYVSHRVSDHTSFLALIERRFLRPDPDAAEDAGPPPHLTARDAHASTLEDLFDFDDSPSRDALVDPLRAVPASPADPGCRPPSGAVVDMGSQSRLGE